MQTVGQDQVERQQIGQHWPQSQSFQQQHSVEQNQTNLHLLPMQTVRHDHVERHEIGQQLPQSQTMVDNCRKKRSNPHQSGTFSKQQPTGVKVPCKKKKPKQPVRRSCRETKNKKPTQRESVLLCEFPSGSDDSELSSSNEADEYNKLVKSNGQQKTSRRLIDETTTAAALQKQKKLRYKWSNGTLKKTPESLQFAGGRSLPSENASTPIQFFRHYFTPQIIDDIAAQSALYATQTKPDKPVRITSGDIEQFIGICLYMSMIRVSYTRNYWSREFRVPQVADNMTLNRFEEIKRCLHFSDNSLPASDKLRKIRPLLESLRQRYLTVPMEEHLSVDEQIVPFKGRSCLRQYIPKKPHKWGYKIWVLCGATGYAYDFECYTGRSDNILLESEEECGASGNVVVRLSRSLPVNVGHKLYFDNYFTNPDLQIYLAKRGILSVGTVRSNRIPQCSLKTENEMKKLGRGAVDEKVACIEGIDITSVRWYDNKAVTLLSTYAGTEPISEVTRWNSKQLVHEKVACPNIITVYNKHMGGVDLMDSLIGLYRIKLRSKKWYHRLFFHVIDMTLINAWLLYRRTVAADNNVASKLLSLHEFKSSVADVLSKATMPVLTTSRRGRPSGDESSTPKAVKRKRELTTTASSNDIRFDGLSHYPLMNKKRLHCKQHNCKGQSMVMCSKCGVCLCLTSKKNCFLAYHSN
jgi:hypothetical protein